ncbi:hypothetical protein [Algibacter pectinivorans]|uniref:Uncharacterized protein n=1 Tax=Algibacter pectinivorans TaxID=870482 RepID=A0A1I1S5T1_9FLAO|nr:hypothetical protein [Algibacter pectinivorans]SFD41875.1 hypothetical protein SAMN04487987_11337 [Algibacter pectinivorans]
MRNWKISEADFKDKYLIPTEKSIWLTDQNKDADINELIDTKKLGTIKSIRYEDLKEIVFIDTDYTVDFRFKDDKTPEEIHKIDKIIYSEIKSYLKSQLKGIEIKDYSVFKQILPQLISLGFSVILIVVTYISAMELEKGESIRISGNKAWLKQIIATIAEMLGTIGTLIVGTLIISSFIYFIVRKSQNPKRGEILKITKTPRLTI